MTEGQPDRFRETSRNEVFSDKVKTRICQEVPSKDNPFLAEQVRWHGYDVAELMLRRDLVDVFYLLLKGELPCSSKKRMFEQTMILLANPGPRHAATRAVLSASAFRTHAHQLLPIGLSLLTGENMGSSEVEGAMRFLVKNLDSDPAKVAETIRQGADEVVSTDGRFAPGFGAHFGGTDPFTASMAKLLSDEYPSSQSLCWGQRFVASFDEDAGGWLLPGLAAAVFVELGFRPAVGACLYQMAACPGLLAHGVEMSNKPITALPFVTDENYHLEGASDVD